MVVGADSVPKESPIQSVGKKEALLGAESSTVTQHSCEAASLAPRLHLASLFSALAGGPSVFPLQPGRCKDGSLVERESVLSKPEES